MNIILTSDFVVPLSILKPTTGIQKADTLRLWDLASRKTIFTITIPDGQGIQDVKFIPGNKESATIATAVGPGQTWIIYPFRKDSKDNQGVAKLLYDFGTKAKNSLAIYSGISDDGKLAYFTFTLGSHVAVLDIPDLDNAKRLDDPNEEQPIIGPHYVKISPDKKNLLIITGYFVQTGGISVVNTPGGYKGHWIDTNPTGSLSFNRTIDFERIFTARSGARPHSSVIFDLTDTKNPIYY